VRNVALSSPFWRVEVKHAGGPPTGKQPYWHPRSIVARELVGNVQTGPGDGREVREPGGREAAQASSRIGEGSLRREGATELSSAAPTRVGLTARSWVS